MIFVSGRHYFPREIENHQKSVNQQHPIIYNCATLKKMELFNENFPFFALSDHFTVRCEVLKSNTIELVISPQTAKVFTCYFHEKSFDDFKTYFYAFLARIKHFDHTCLFGKIKESDEKDIFKLILRGIHHINKLTEEFMEKKNYGKNIWIQSERGPSFQDRNIDETFFIL